MKNILPGLALVFGVAVTTGAEAAIPTTYLVKKAAACITGDISACNSLLRYAFAREEKPVRIPKYRRRHPEQEP